MTNTTNRVALLFISGIALGCTASRDAGPAMEPSSGSPINDMGTASPPATSTQASDPESPHIDAGNTRNETSVVPVDAMDSAGSKTIDAEPLPPVSVKNIGMHIGGGPNDQPSKQPIADSVRPHFDELRRCFRLVDDPAKGGDFGVDLLIPLDGGKAQVSHPRTSLKGDNFQACVVGVFADIDFLKPKTGRTMVSYSVRFTP